jgi:hypothetical protein
MRLRIFPDLAFTLNENPSRDHTSAPANGKMPWDRKGYLVSEK